MTHEEIVTELMRLDDEDSNAKADAIMERFNFPNTYCVGKKLTEELVNDYHRSGLPCCIIRPSLVTCIEKDPYPGYIGNLAGLGGIVLAFGYGFYEHGSCAWSGSGIFDFVPGDIVSSVILAAAASVASCTMKVRLQHTVVNWDISTFFLFTSRFPIFCF